MYRITFGLEETTKVQREQRGNILCEIKKQRLMIYQVPFGVHLHIDQYNNASGEFMKIFVNYLKTTGIETKQYDIPNRVEYNLESVVKDGRRITQKDLELLEPFEEYCKKNNIDLTELRETYEVKDKDGNIRIHYETYMDMFDSDMEDEDYYNNEYIGGYWNVSRNKNKQYIN